MSAALTLEAIPASQVTDTMLHQAATLFSSAYGIWGPDAESKMGKYCKPGKRVRMSVERLREQSLRPSTDSVLVRGMAGEELAGYAFATRWIHEGRRICWVTQLCVSHEYRRKGLATQILMRLLEGEDGWGFGILSSHPAAIMAVLRAWDRGIENASFNTVKEHGADIMAAAPIKYVRDARLKGSVFGIDDGAVCCAHTNFWVDHAEPLAVLAEVKQKVTWPFGELPHGCEFLVLVKREETRE